MSPDTSVERYKAILFDVDGTLIDSMDMLVNGLGESYMHFLGKRPTDAELLAILGMPLRQQMQLFQKEPAIGDQLDRMCSFTLERFYANQHFESEFTPAVKALEAAYRGGLRTALVTSKGTLELAGLLTRYSFGEYCTATVCAADVSQPKPDPESALLACKLLDVQPNEAIFVGDSVFDMRCAKAAGVATLAVLYGAGSRSELLDEQPDFVCESAADLLDLIQTRFLIHA